MASKLPVVINRASGAAAALGASLRDIVEDAFAATGRTVAIELVDSSTLGEALARHRGEPRLVVGGGDGTLACAAAVLANTPTALGLLPLGMRNRHALDFGIPLDLEAAAAVAVAGQRRRIDVGAAGERVFVNSATFGIYTRFVHQREHPSRPRWRSALPAAWHVLRNMRAQHFSLALDGEPRSLVTPLLAVGNARNPVEPEPIEAALLDNDGELTVYAVAPRGPHRLAAFALRALLGFARPEREFVECAGASEMVIEGLGWIECALDGDLEWLPLPLRLRSLPGALGIVTPHETAQPGRNLFRIHGYRTH